MKTFVQKAKKKIKQKLEIFLKHEDIGMSKEQYLMMCEQTGEEIDWDRCPPEAEDFPESVATALNIFYSLGDRIFPDVGFTGKDYTNLEHYLRVYHITEKVEIDWTTELLLWFEARTIKESQDRLKSEMERLKRKK